MADADVPSPPERTSRPHRLPRRCIQCFYVLDHLGEEGCCPECGRPFVMRLPQTYTTKPPFVWWTFWVPGLVASFVFGVVSYTVLLRVFGYTWATVIGVPAAAGVLLGYATNVQWIRTAALIIIAVCAIIAALMIQNVLGALCGATMGVIALAPFILGSVIGFVLRTKLKRTRFSMRDYLPIVILACLLLSSAAIEGRHPHLAIVSTSTLAVIDATPEQTWKAIQFYEQVRHAPPWLLRLTPCLRPAYTTGHGEKVGDIKICFYERGRLTKQITEVIPGKRLAFRVIEQKEIETDGVRLIDGSFDLTAAADGKHTTVTLTTRYEPLLTPRFAFKWSEDMAVHTLHGHVLRGMKDDAEGRPQ